MPVEAEEGVDELGNLLVELVLPAPAAYAWLGDALLTTQEVHLEEGCMTATLFGALERRRALAHVNPAVRALAHDMFKVGEHVFLTPKVGKTCQIARILHMFETNETKRKMLYVQRFYRPEELQMTSTMAVHTHEVFSSAWAYTCGVEDIVCRCHVFQLPSAPEEGVTFHLPDELTQPRHFFFFRKYDPHRQIFTIADNSGPQEEEADGEREVGVGLMLS